jgi:hypothetical protein
MKGKEKREREDGGAGNVKVDERKKKSLARSLALLSKVSISSQKKNQNDAAAQISLKDNTASRPPGPSRFLPDLAKQAPCEKRGPVTNDGIKRISKKKEQAAKKESLYPKTV